MKSNVYDLGYKGNAQKISSMIWGKELENGEYICSSSIATRITPERLQFAYNNDFL